MEFASIEDLARACTSIFAICSDGHNWLDWDRYEDGFRVRKDESLRGFHNEEYYVLGPLEGGRYFRKEINASDIPAILKVWEEASA